MTAPAAVIRGAGTVRRAWRVWLLIWILTLAFAAVLVAPVAAVLYARLGHSLYAARMFENFDIQWLAEFRNETGAWPGIGYAPAAALIFLAYLLLTTFLTGGALTVFARSGEFWSGCGRNFWRLLRLLLLSVCFYAIVYLVYFELGSLRSYLWGEGLAERPLAISGWARAAVTLLLFLIVNMVFDYAKIRLVVEGPPSARSAVRGAFALVWHHPAATSVTYALVAISALALGTLYWRLSGALPRTNVVWLAVVFLIQQAFVAARIFVRLLFFSAQLEIWRRFAPSSPEVNVCA